MQAGAKLPERNLAIAEASWQGLVDVRKELIHATKLILESVETAKRELTEEENGVCDFIHDWAGCINYELDWRTEIGNRNPSAARIPQRGDVSESEWRTKEGTAVHVLTRDQHVCNVITQDDPEQQGLRFPQMMRAMVLGPKTDAERRALSEGTDGAGGYTVNARLAAQLIDRLRAKSRVVQAGAVTLPLETLTTKIARISADPTVSWKSENASLSDSDLTFESVTFTARTLMALVKASRELLEDSVNAEEALMTAFAGAMATELDRVALYGSGIAPEPSGLSATGSGINNIDVNVGMTNWDNLVDGWIKILASNANAPTAAIMHANTLGVLAKTKDTEGVYLDRPEILRNLPLLDTGNVRLDDAGSPSGTSIFLGYWPDMIIGVRTQMRVEILRELYAASHQYGFVAWLRADIQLLHPKSFCRIQNIESVPNP